MYCIMFDKKTKTYYMLPERFDFYAFSSPEKYETRDQNARIVETEYDTFEDLVTELYNAGFTKGYLDDKPVFINRKSVSYYARNSNEILYAQYLLTKKEDYLREIEKKKLVTICKIEDNVVYFPVVTIQDTPAVLAYTDQTKIPQRLFDKYPGYRIVKMSYDMKCIINGQVISD